MDLHKLFGPITKWLFTIAAILILYGYVCRWFNIYFFWESSTVGWTLFLLFLIGIMWNSMQIKKAEDRKTIGNKIGIGIIVFIFIIAPIVMASIYCMGIYADAKTFIVESKRVEHELGRVQSVILKPKGSVETSESKKGRTGRARLFVII